MVLQEKQFAVRFGNLAAQVHLTQRKVPTLLMLHGWQDNSGSFEPLAPTLSEHFDLVMPDWPGHGLSDHKGADSYYPFFDYVDDLHQLILQLGDRPVYLVGHSLGALVASCWCAAFAERAKGLVMIEALGPMSERDDKVVERLRQGIDSRHALKPLRELPSLEAALKLRRGINKVAIEDLTPLVTRGIKQVEDVWQWRHDAKLKADSIYRMSAHHAEHLIRAIDCPVLAIIGDDGYPELRSPLAEQRKAWFKNLTVETVAGTHHCHLQSQADTAALIIDFVTKLHLTACDDVN
ncbi:alpha/beta fold hydrolase [Enterovibrio paralichthyis]|uniref:alpha/beta fold hydrolase n=1 Tax=Enterovibrio paralichthyis TaxID=2853805 RepID=UPI001C46EE9E|nr:alpha/beta hydrolase [Enterovibrio paralichthyis]MBV7299548.1 alpha/beta hydrolase [Enterovibrio paralichthyis]